MAATIPPVIVDKPTASMPLRYGLFQAAIGPLDLPVHARNGGLQYDTSVCGIGFGYEIDCIDGQANKSSLWTENGVTTVLGTPFMVNATMQCGSVGYTFEELRSFMVDRFKSVEQSMVEEILSTGDFDASPALNAASGITTVTGGGTTSVDVISELEQAFYCGGSLGTVYGQPAFLHMNIPVFNDLKSQHLIEFDGTRWRTPMGSVVSPGCYINQDPDGVLAAEGTFWIYITGQTTIWRTPDSAIQIAPVEGSLDRTTNQFLMLAEREYVVTFECAGYAKEVTLWEPAA